MVGTEFFLDKDHGWSVENGRLVKTFTVADADRFIEDIDRLGKIFEHDPENITRLDNHTVKLELLTHETDSITGRDKGLANSINLIAQNQEMLEEFDDQQRMEVIGHIATDCGLPTKFGFLSTGQKFLLASLLKHLTKIGRTLDVRLIRTAQTEPDTSTIGSPEVSIAPSLQSDIEEALVRIRQQVDPNYFKNVSRIDVLLGGPFGQVSSDDPAVVKINLNKIKQEVKRQLDQRLQQDNVKYDQSDPAHQEIFDEVLTRALIEVVSHEKGHVEDFEPKISEEGEFLGGDFPGGEAPAEQEAERVKQVTHSSDPLQL